METEQQSDASLPSPQLILDRFLCRDKFAVEELQSMWGPQSESMRLQFTEARCKDTAEMVVYILKYLSAMEQKS